MSLAIALAATKGGCGKSTLTACLAVHAASDRTRVAIIDLDPQGSIRPWWKLRDAENPGLFTGITSLAEDIAFLKDNGWSYIFVDTPPGNIEIVEEAIASVDIALIPSRPSPVDILAMRPTIDACRNAGTPFAFIVNCYDPTWKISASAVGALEIDGPVLPPPIHYRAAYTSAMTLGKTGPESQDRKQAKACKDEIAALWASVLRAADGSQ